MAPIILDQQPLSAAFIFKLGGLDLHSYLRVNPDDRMDPQGAPWVNPTFSETPFSDGQVLISTTVMIHGIVDGRQIDTYPGASGLLALKDAASQQQYAAGQLVAAAGAYPAATSLPLATDPSAPIIFSAAPTVAVASAPSPALSGG
jgi:hypothetical protein